MIREHIDGKILNLELGNHRQDSKSPTEIWVLVDPRFEDRNRVDLTGKELSDINLKESQFQVELLLRRHL
jgi:hypothetical protein